MLRLVEKVATVVSFDEAAALAEARDLLRAEAAEIEACYGKNAYSDFLVQHGRYPDPKQAAMIGQIVGLRVRSSDGSMQPRRTNAERETIKAVRERRREKARYRVQVDRLLQAISCLAENVDPPGNILRHVHPQFDEPIIRGHLDHAVGWMIRFAEEWNRRDNQADKKIPRAPSGNSS